MEIIRFDKQIDLNTLIGLCDAVNASGIDLGVVSDKSIQFDEPDRGKVTAALDQLGIKYPKNGSAE